MSSHTSLVMALALLLPGAALVAQGPFPNTCPGGAPLPFAAIEAPHPIDQTCYWLDGKQTAPAPTRLQDAAKNNFCIALPLAKAELYTPQRLIDLQGTTHLATGEGQEPANRAGAQQLGEGKLIKIAAFIIEAHFADVGSGESVNCEDKTEAGNDIHIALGPTAATLECASVTAEISPHYRPATWEQIGQFQSDNTATKKTSVNAALKARLQAQPLRFTGQLFFDASHAPCPCGTTNCDPARSSDWELHPVYRIEVCKTATTCDANNDAQWTPFDTWWNSLPPLPAAAHKTPAVKKKK